MSDGLNEVCIDESESDDNGSTNGTADGENDEEEDDEIARRSSEESCGEDLWLPPATKRDAHFKKAQSRGGKSTSSWEAGRIARIGANSATGQSSQGGFISVLVFAASVTRLSH